MIEQLLLYTYCLLCYMAASDALPRGIGFSIQAAFLEVRKCHWRLLFLLNLFKVLSF